MAVGSIGQQGQAGAFFSAALGGCLRIPALLVSANAVAMTGELALRGLQTLLALAGIKVDDKDSLVNKAVAKLPANVNFRPYKNETQWTNKKLLISAVACAAIGIVGTEFANFFFGSAPDIYNRVLTYLGPVRIDNVSWFKNVGLT
jgi:hypothetical protein